MAQADDKFFDAKEHQEPALQPALQPSQQKSKIIKKKSKNPENPEPKRFTTKDNEYLEYKKQLLGKAIPDRTDGYCDFYLCNDIDQIKYFIKNIREYALNTNISTEHINNIARKINKTKELYFVNPIAIVEYVNHKASTPKDLIEIIDGHHRIRCLKKLFNDNEYDNIDFTFWIQVYKCDTEDEAKELFRKYNTSKPFPINLDMTDLMTLIIDKLNTQFSINTFEFIKNTKQRANRPSICKKEFAEKLAIRLKEQLKTTENNECFSSSDIDIDKIITKFINYNNALLSETLDWFNKNSNSGKITEKIYKKAKDNNCVLGLLTLEELINACVCL